MRVCDVGQATFLTSGGIGAVTYQCSGIGAIEAEERDGRLDGLVGGGVRANLRGKSPRGSCSPGGAEQCLSRQHGGLWKRVVDGGSSRFQLTSLDRMSSPGVGKRKPEKWNVA